MNLTEIIGPDGWDNNPYDRPYRVAYFHPRDDGNLDISEACDEFFGVTLNQAGIRRLRDYLTNLLHEGQP